ncbi:hypothetical protein PVT67_14150 [Gallaecimonas kandeliae]|uniref:hypothetical protein n=1 Tax=Gallaecimonas kandeliae TaxID=3029055 RepID=UPI0026496E0C|nr:hypothetical protein [Gallaecimonas kandeliae]WKE64796.1 hypothetical protein PVT67_14150 [Gallaecimonas kandeliae]
MSMELFVIMALKDMPNTDQMNALAVKESLPIIFNAHVDMKKHTGYLPAVLNGKKSGVETYVSDYGAVSADFPDFDSGKYESPVVVTFRWGGDFSEMTVAMAMAYLLSENFSATTFEPQGGTFLNTEDLQQGFKALLEHPIDGM